MNTRIKALFLALVLPFAACGEESAVSAAQDLANSAKDAVKSMDFSSLSPEAMKGKAGELMSGVTEQFSNVKDLASAEKLKEMAGPMLDGLGNLKKLMGDKMPSMESLGSAVEAMKSKFSGDSSIMKVLQPIIDQVKGMLG